MTSPTDSDRRDLAVLSLNGLSVGDAFGESFVASSSTVEQLIEARAFPRAPWRWTDDTAMAVAVVEVLSQHGRIDTDALANAFARHYADDPERGYGPGAFKLLHSLCLGVPWREASGQAFGGRGSFGNGGAMRSAPIGGFFWDNYDLVVENAVASAEPTHAHPEGKAGAIAVAVAAAAAARMEAGTEEQNGAALLDTVLKYCPRGETYSGLQEARRIPLDNDPIVVATRLGNGAQVSAQDTVPFCIWSAAKHLGNYEEALWGTVAALGDRDTTCAIVGGIVGLCAGREGIPQELINAREPLPRGL